MFENMFMVALTFLPCFAIGLIYVISELLHDSEDYGTWLQYTLDAINNGYMVYLFSFFYKTWTQIWTFLLSIQKRIPFIEKKRNEGELQVSFSLKSKEIATGKYEERKLHLAEREYKISQSTNTASPVINNGEKVSRKSKETCTKNLLKKDFDSMKSIQTIEQLSNQMNKLKKEYEIVSEWAHLLWNGNNILKKKLVNLEKEKRVNEMFMWENVTNLEKLLQEKDSVADKLCNNIKILGVENTKLKGKENTWKSSAKQLKSEIVALILANNNQELDIDFSLDTANWKEKMDDDHWEWKTSPRTYFKKKVSSFSRRRNGIWKKRLMKHNGNGTVQAAESIVLRTKLDF